MICPFRIHTKTITGWHRPDANSSGYDEEETTRTFELCHGDECPYYYVNENDVPKCARCNGPEEEEIL